MQVFSYVAKNDAGDEINSTVRAASKSDAISLLRKQGLTPVEVELPSPGLSKQGLQQAMKQIKRVSAKDRVIFTRQLATMIKAGLPISQALSLTVNQIDNPKLAEALDEAHNKVESGTSLSEALSEYPDIFNNTYVSMIAAGETSGNLDDTLVRLADQEEKNHAMISKIRGAFLYPAIVFLVLIGVTALMVTMVLPEVGNMYNELGQEVPFFTGVLLTISDLARRYFYLFILGGLGALIGTGMYFRTPKGKQKLDYFKLNVPVFKTLIRKMYMARFARTMSSLISSGVPILESLKIAKKSLNNHYLGEAIDEIYHRVKAGDPLSQPIERSDLFLPLMGQMLHVGEKTGGVDATLERVASYYEEEVDNTVSTIQTLIEPITIVVLGGMVFFLIIAVIFPIYNLVNNIR